MQVLSINLKKKEMGGRFRSNTGGGVRCLFSNISKLVKKESRTLDVN